jgi:OmpA-OmpF porin, OOP family
MKLVLRCLLLFLLAGTLSQSSDAQILKGIGDRVKRKAEDRANRKIDQGIDKGLDKVEEAAKPDPGNKDGGGAGGNETGTGNEGGSGGAAGSGGKAPKNQELAYKSKFDFVPGEKIVAFEDFTQDAIGDFPARWNTNSTGEIVNVDGKEGKWLMLNKEGVFMPEFITGLPENFTLEFDVACNNAFSYYSTAFHANIAALKNAKEFTNWKTYAGGKTGTMVWMHPLDAGGSRGHSGYSVWNGGAEDMKNEASTYLFHSKTGKNVVHVSIWRQKQRLRVYLDAEKVWDVPKGFDAALKYNAIVFSTGGFHIETDRYFVGNIRLAVGAPDTRNKLITEGKFVTAGILFDINSDKIKGESFGMIKEIANVLKENADVKVKVIGHTDSDGDDAKNLDLSKKRAAAVKNSLVKDFGISASRIETDGKGETQPVVKNDTPENKAQNRRVEFIKL